MVTTAFGDREGMMEKKMVNEDIKPNSERSETERQDWRVEPMPIHGWRIVNAEGKELIRDIYAEGLALRIVSEHNQHTKLVEALTLAAEQAERASLVQDRSVGIIKQACALIASDLRAALNPKG